MPLLISSDRERFPFVHEEMGFSAQDGCKPESNKYFNLSQEKRKYCQMFKGGKECAPCVSASRLDFHF